MGLGNPLPARPGGGQSRAPQGIMSLSYLHFLARFLPSQYHPGAGVSSGYRRPSLVFNVEYLLISQMLSGETRKGYCHQG